MPVPSSVQTLLDLPDLTLDPSHAISLMVERIAQALAQKGWPPQERLVGDPIVSAQHNYSLLGYPADSVVQAGRYTHWVDEGHLLRTQTTSVVLETLQQRTLSLQPITWLAPGMVYRRDVRDRWHCGQPHQMDIWVLMPKAQEADGKLRELVEHVCNAAMGDMTYRLNPTEHPYTRNGLEIEARWQEQWLEVGECGLIDPQLLVRLGIDPCQWGGLAMGVGLDRLVMVSKELPDIRLLRDPGPRVGVQMKHLDSWKEISKQPAATRCLSIARPQGESEEALTEACLGAMGEQGDYLESLTVQGRWERDQLPQASIDRLGIGEGQENVAVELIWRHPSKSLSRETINSLGRQVYHGVHQGSGWAYCP